MRTGALLGALLGFLALAFLRRHTDVVEVRGRSMAPALLPGDRLIVARLAPRAGDVVLAADPRTPQRELIKRAVSADERGVVLRGDNAAASTDARAFGALPASAVSWRVVLRYWPVGRIGPIGPPPRSFDEGGEAACAFPETLIAGG